MADLSGAFRVESISLGDVVGVFYGSNDPTQSPGEAAPVGSLFLRDTGELYQKTNTNDTDWTLFSSGSSATDTLSGNITVTATSYTASDRVVILVDTTNNAVEVQLPSAANYENKFFHIKWIGGKRSNKVTIKSQSGETIDGETSHILGLLYDSLNIFSNGTNWHII